MSIENPEEGPELAIAHFGVHGERIIWMGPLLILVFGWMAWQINKHGKLPWE